MVLAESLKDSVSKRTLLSIKLAKDCHLPYHKPIDILFPSLPHFILILFLNVHLCTLDVELSRRAKY